MKIHKNTLASVIALLYVAQIQAAPMDGDWIGSLKCGASIQNPDKAPAFTNPLKMTVSAGRAKMMRDTEIVKESYRGSVSGNGQTSLAGSGQYKDPSKTGTWSATANGQFTDGQFRGKGEIIGGNGQKVRDCVVELAKVESQPIAQLGKPAAVSASVGVVAAPTSSSSAAPADVVPGNANSNPLAFLIDAKVFIGSPALFQENYWGDPKGLIFGKSSAQWTDQDFQILERKLQEQIDIERKVAADRMRKVGLKGSPDDDSIFSVYKQHLEKAIAEIPKFKYWTGLSRERLRENEARQQAQEQQRLAREQQQQQESVQRQNQQMAMEQQRQATGLEQHQQQYAQNRAESDRRESDKSKSNNLVYAIAALAVAAGAWIWNRFIRNRCPKCKSAGYDKVSATEIDRWLGNKTVHEKHSRGTNTRNVRTTYVKKLYEFRCKSCQTTWSKERKEELDGVSALEIFITGFQ